MSFRKRMKWMGCASAGLLFIAGVMCPVARAQNPTPTPATDSSSQASPASTRSAAPRPGAASVDSATESSPVSGIPSGTTVPAHMALPVTLKQAINSATAHNGDSVRGVLAAPLHTSKGQVLPAGTRVQITVVAVAAAGKISSAGEVTLQVIKVGALAVQSNELVFRGQRGQKELADSAPAKGAEAQLSSGTALHFEVIPAMPQPATGPPSKPAIGSPQPQR